MNLVNKAVKLLVVPLNLYRSYAINLLQLYLSSLIAIIDLGLIFELLLLNTLLKIYKRFSLNHLTSWLDVPRRSIS